MERSLAPVRTEAERAIVVAFLDRLWGVISSPLGDRMIETLRRFGRAPEAVQASVGKLARSAVVLKPTANRAEVSRWLLAHALRRGLALPGLQRRDLFVAMAELVADYADIAAVMDRRRDEIGFDETPDARRDLDRRKVMTRVSRLNARRRTAGYSL